jgi:hypothetical protein
MVVVKNNSVMNKDNARNEEQASDGEKNNTTRAKGTR